MLIYSLYSFSIGKVRAAALKHGSATSESPKKSNSKIWSTTYSWHLALTCSFTADTIFLKDLPDPDRCYKALANANSLSGVTIHVPDIRDSQGRSIPPTEYENKLVDGTVVELEVMPKLYLYLFFFCCQLICFSAGYSGHVKALPPGVEMPMGHTYTSSKSKKWMSCHTPTMCTQASSTRENARQVQSWHPHWRNPRLPWVLLVLWSGQTWPRRMWWRSEIICTISVY